MFWTLDNRFINGWRYRDGVVYGKLEPVHAEDVETRVIVFGTRSGDWHIELDEIIIIGGLKHANLYTEEIGYLVFPPDDGQRADGGVDTSGPVVDMHGGSGSNSNNTTSIPELKGLDEIIIDNSFKDTKAECTYNKLLNLSGGFKKAIQKFDGEFPVNHLHFSVSYDLPANVSGRTYPPQKFITKIAINRNNLDRPNLDIARTIIHETIHAEMFRKIMSIINNGGSLEGLTKAQWTEKLSKSDYPGILDYYTRYGVDNMQHEQMAAHYINTMAGLLKEFDRGQNSNQFYEDIAWEGLMGTSTNIELKDTEKPRIENTINQLMKDGNKICN